MAFQKIPKEQWFKMSQEERDYHTLEFHKHSEKRRYTLLWGTRIIAIFFILGLFYMGYSQMIQAQTYDAKLREYGSYGYCALCGEYNLKKCECVYATTNNAGMRIEINLTQKGLELAQYNAGECKSFYEYKRNKTEELLSQEWMSSFLNNNISNENQTK
jgi:hypothetical protein